MRSASDYLAGLRSASDWRTAIAALAGSSPTSSVAVPSSSMRDAPAGEANWCHCMLHSESTSSCAAAPAWLQDHTGRDGELFFKVQDSAWGNAMMQLRDSVSPPTRARTAHTGIAHAEPVCVVARAARNRAGLEPAPRAGGRRLVVHPLSGQPLVSPRGLALHVTVHRTAHSRSNLSPRPHLASLTVHRYVRLCAVHIASHSLTVHRTLRPHLASPSSTVL